MIQTRMVDVNKDMAELFLSYEVQPQPGVRGANRKFSPMVVNTYAVDMLAGRWRTTHQGMAFKGFLKDGTAVFGDGGQRARAVVQAATVGAQGADRFYDPDPRITIKFMVSEGLTDDDIKALDSGKRRLPGEVLAMEGYVNTSLLAAVLNGCILYETVPWSRENWSKAKISSQQRQDYLDANPRVEEALAHGTRVNNVMNVSAAAIGWFQAIKSGQEEKTINEFMDLLFTGAGIDKGNPIHTLREMFLKARKSKHRYERNEQLALFIRAYMKWVAGQESYLLVFKTRGDSPDKFPRFTG